ncbi:hypothetical protein [Micromonospora sp. NPDC005174]|uniref:hypothetical protein n=1 Tax=Micromonospora sp. NPDC005174 TaxID=3157018 RepID=UPI0033BA143C
MKVLLRGGPADGRVINGGGETVVRGACLYERTGQKADHRGKELPVYGHRADCCEADGRGAVDGCE